MIVIAFVDAKEGMMFNHRRQSRDQAVTERIREICERKRLWMNRKLLLRTQTVKRGRRQVQKQNRLKSGHKD